VEFAETVNGVESRIPPTSARIKVAPLAIAVAMPVELIVATAGRVELHAASVRLREDPSSSIPVARNAVVPPTATIASRGVTVIEESLGGSPLALVHPTRSGNAHRAWNWLLMRSLPQRR
jgi:hypothetical protein